MDNRQFFIGNAFMNRRYESCIVWLVAVLMCMPITHVRGQLNCDWTHYSAEEGLSQNAVMDMLQDQRGVMWLATWDGLNSFDGYNFRQYKTSVDSVPGLSNNRIDEIMADAAGRIWMRTYDNRAYVLNTVYNDLWPVMLKNNHAEEKNVTRMVAMPDSTVWLMSDAGAMKATVLPDNKGVETTLMMDGQIHEVMPDGKGNEWLLTDKGVYRYSRADKGNPVLQMTEEMKHAVAIKHGVAMTDGKVLWLMNVENGERKRALLPQPCQVTDVLLIGENSLLVVTRNEGLIIYDAVADKWNNVIKELPIKRSIEGCYVDKNNNVWIDQHLPGVVTRVELPTGKAQVIIMKVEEGATDDSYPKFSVMEDVMNQVWVHPYGGGMGRWNAGEQRLQPIEDLIVLSSGKLSNKLHSAYCDKQGNLWMCTHSKGLEKLSFKNNRDISMLQPAKTEGHGLLANEVRAICVVNTGDVWVGTKDGKVHLYDDQYRYKGFLGKNGDIISRGEPMKGVPYCIKQDSRGWIWIATKGDGLICLTQQQGNDWVAMRYKHNPADATSLCHNNVYSILEDRNGRIWVATYGAGIAMIDPDKPEMGFLNHRNGLENYPIKTCAKARHLSMDARGRIWIATTAGALRMELTETAAAPQTTFEHFYSDSKSKQGLTANDVHWIEHTPEGETYIATFGGGLNLMQPEGGPDGGMKVEQIGRQEGVASDILLAICPDRWGNLWMATENGISQLNIPMRAIMNFNRLAPQLRMTEAAIAQDKQGNILMGTSDGLLMFKPEKMRKSLYIPHVLWTELRIGNRNLKPDSCSVLKLKHNENNIHLQYAAVDFVNPHAVQYAYRLSGWEKQWNYVGNNRTATYTNLPPGEYNLEVRSTNADGMWTPNNRTLTLIVEQHPWRTPWAYAAYVLAVLCLMAGATWALTAIYRLRHKVLMEHSMSEMKLRFFTDVSHELRTPLTLIAGPIENILQNKQLDPVVKKQLQMVNGNTERMLRLVNQILDLRKLQNGKMTLNIQPIDLVPFVKNIMNHFQQEATNRKIEFWMQTETPQITLWADADKLEKIIYNLLANAFKFTPDGKMIGIEIGEDEQQITIAVKDEGVGIEPERKKSIFERFENKNSAGQTGTGIGLALVKELVQLHGATIDVESRMGQGSCFSIKINKRTPQELPTTEEEQATNLDQETIETNSPEQMTMLLVEDNAELRDFIKTIFQDEYQVLMAADGEQGLKKTTELLPDVILADVMMPCMDGLEMTRNIRRNPDTSHIPIVLLTAKTDMESKLKGLEYEADDYITKPFSTQYLKARITNLLERRKNLHAHFMDGKTAGQNIATQEETPQMTTHDKRFMDKLMELMEKNIDNGELVVDDLVKEMAVSRSVFFKKVKSLTGLAPVEFIKEVRINRAKQLIDQGEYTITQIAYMVGINDPRYFSKCFKQKIGMTPTEYRDSKK